MSHTTFMQLAIAEAKQALAKDEVPVGAIIVSQNKIIARAYNYCEHLCDPTAHAEMQAITAATHFLGSKYLTDCTLYVTLEPCVMCAGALNHVQISHVVYGAADPKKGFEAINTPLLHPKTTVTAGVLATECAALLTDFFKAKRI